MSIRQAVIPDALIGRVMGAWRTAVWGSMPVGGLLGGFVAKAYGLRAPFVMGAVVQVALTIPTLRLRIPTEPATAAFPPASPGSSR